jgi:hypothetical protein
VIASLCTTCPVPPHPGHGLSRIVPSQSGQVIICRKVTACLRWLHTSCPLPPHFVAGGARGCYGNSQPKLFGGWIALRKGDLLPPKAEVTGSNPVGRASHVSDLNDSAESARGLNSPKTHQKKNTACRRGSNATQGRDGLANGRAGFVSRPSDSTCPSLKARRMAGRLQLKGGNSCHIRSCRSWSSVIANATAGRGSYPLCGSGRVAWG